MANYPTSVFTFTNRQDNVDEVAAADYNGLAAEIAAVESGLETGLQHDLKPDATNTRALGSSSLGWQAFLSAPVFLPTRKTDTGTVNDYALGGFGLVLLNNASDLTITGIAAGKDGELKLLQSVGAGNVFLAHQNTGSVAANRLQNMATSGNTPLAAGVGSALYQYDGTNAYWRLVQHEQGAPIAYTPTWTNGGSIGNGTFTGHYMLRGRLVEFQIQFMAGSTTTFGSTGWTIGQPPLFPSLATMPYTAAVHAIETGVAHHIAIGFSNGTAGFSIVNDANTASGYGSTTPFTWGSGDSFQVSGSYFTS